MLGSRRGRPSLIGTAARTAVITKTATSVAGSSAAKQQQAAHARELAHAQQMAAVGAPAAPVAVQPAASVDGDGLGAGLRALAAAHDAGVLNDAEFAAKAKALLG